ncbi:hypothetical protein MNBD_GAMMA17-1650 [hydrothermal vent metagenome]|uniref:Ketosynthase n=1 Tax=hydrothermal vent metagenome TaxID=652676 RepID=A0A3B0ZVY0_9ZZZZ
MQVALLLLYPLNVHLGIALEWPVMQLFAIMALAAGILYKGLKRGDSLPWLIFLPVVLVSAGTAYFDIAIFILYLPPILIPLLIFSLFFRSLMPGGIPVVTDIGEQARGPLTAEMRHYTRMVTVVWVVVLGLLTLEAAILPWVASEIVWSLFTNVVNYLVIAFLFAGEYVVRRVRFRDHDHPGFIQYLRIIFNANVRKR